MKNYESPRVVHVDVVSKNTMALLSQPMLLMKLNPAAYAKACQQEGTTPEQVEHEQWAKITDQLFYRLAEAYLEPGPTQILANLGAAIAGDGHHAQGRPSNLTNELGSVWWLQDELKSPGLK